MDDIKIVLPPPKDGIEKCEDLCKCGEHLLLHTYTFGRKIGKPNTKHYISCPKCGAVTNWHNTMDEAIEAFDAGETPDISKFESSSEEVSDLEAI